MADGDDNEALVPHSHAVLGLKVADAEEAETVKQMSFAVLGLVVLLPMLFVVHAIHHGHLWHAVGHVLIAAVLPAAGYVAISQRSTKAAWAFHLMTVIVAVFHAVMLIVVFLHVVHLMEMGAEGSAEAVPCLKMARPCEASVAQKTRPMNFSPDHRFWRCHHGFCIEGASHCDGQVNCFDHSDELGCIDETALAGVHAGVPTIAPMKAGKEMEDCVMLRNAQEKAPRLKWWWLLISVLLWVLCWFAAYHSLEFYVQLRVRGLSARVDRSTADATVFDRAEADRRADEVAE
uniref:Uncharacterized protein n=1 Tax=Pyrodinium bahamense TaxID=73915 RepID=A0A7S0FA53_9DINO